MSEVSGKYRLDTRLGGGGMAEVFLGSTLGAEGFSRRVAIKRVLPGYSDNDQFAQMFVAEARISSQLVHPNIVSVLDFDRDADRRLFLVMELVEGKDLDALAHSGLLPIPVVIFVIAEVLRGLGFAHDLPVGTDMRGVVHRDVSPHNVLLSWEGAVKVSDFGIAKAREASEATASVFIKGKPAYMSPEQANGQALDGRSDLFAVGIMTWEMLVGRRLFMADDTRATLAAVLFGQVPRLRTVRADVPKDLERFVMKLLEKDPAARYPTAEAAIADLMNCADAPRSGRELLSQVLLERFPEHAPVRQSIMRARSRNAVSVPPGSHPGAAQPGAPDVPFGAPTMPEYGGARAVPLPSLGAIRNAATHTLELSAPPGRWGKRAALVVLVVAGSAAVTFGVVKTMRRRAPGGAAPVVVAVAAPDAADAADAPTPDAPADATDRPTDPVAPPPDAPAGVDGGMAVPDSGKGVPRPGHEQAGRPQTGTLIVTAHPPVDVFVDGSRRGAAYLKLALAAGTHMLKLVSFDDDGGKHESGPRRITIKANADLVIDPQDWMK